MFQLFGLYRQHKKSKAFKFTNLKALLWTFQVITTDEESSLRTHYLGYQTLQLFDTNVAEMYL